MIDACAFTNNQATASTSNGGAIYTTDQLTVSASSSAAATFSGNSAMSGGAIQYTPVQNASSSMSLTSTAFTDNKAGYGGAVNSDVATNQGTVTVTVSGCLFSGNQAAMEFNQDGGAIYVSHQTSGTGSASFAVTNSTFYENTAYYNGGALWLQNSNSGTGTNTASLTSLTVFDNTAYDAGGGVWIDPGMTAGLQVQIDNSIIAGDNILDNPPSNGPDVFGTGTVQSLKFNLIGNTDGSNGWTGQDYTGDSSQPLNPLLDTNGPTNNGGLTYTIKLMPGSQAYRHGDPADGAGFDQRGYTRQPIDSIGAYDPDAKPPQQKMPPPP